MNYKFDKLSKWKPTFTTCWNRIYMQRIMLLVGWMMSDHEGGR